MQQRAAIVRALSFNPSLLLMDEPFGALDAFTRDEMNLLVEEIWLETKKTIVFITHNITEAVFLSDRVFVMSARPGRISSGRLTFPFPRPRTLDLLATKEVFDLVNDDQGRDPARADANQETQQRRGSIRLAERPRGRTRSMVDKELGDQDPGVWQIRRKEDQIGRIDQSVRVRVRPRAFAISARSSRS